MIAIIQTAGGVDDFLKELFAEMISESCIGSVQIFCFFGSPNFCPFAVDHHLTTTVQRYYKKPKKPALTTTGFFLFWELLCRTNKINGLSLVYTALS